MKLISSPSEYPRAYICDECVAVCASIIEDDRLESNGDQALASQSNPHPLLDHPRASELMAAVETWVREESLGNDGIAALRDVYEIASRMFEGR